LAALVFNACGDSGDPTSPPPVVPATLSGSIEQTAAANAGVTASWVGDVDIKTTTDYSGEGDAKSFTVSHTMARPPRLLWMLITATPRVFLPKSTNS
jgi:hypothetical protein